MASASRAIGALVVTGSVMALAFVVYFWLGTLASYLLVGASVVTATEVYAALHRRDQARSEL